MKTDVFMIRLPELIKRSGLSRTSIQRAVANGILPRAVAVSERCRAWPSNEIDAVLQARIAGRSDEELRELVRAMIAAREHVA
jgi:prophage regulatory protein